MENTTEEVQPIEPFPSGIYKPYMPEAFDSSLSYYEQIVSMIEYLNKMGLLSNSLVAQWNAFMKEFNKNLSDTVGKILLEWLAEGIVETIIANAMLDVKLQSSDGTKWVLVVDNYGNLSVVKKGSI